MAAIYISSWQTALGNVATDTLSAILGFLPNALGAIIVLLLGILIANWSKTLVIKTLQALKLQSLVRDSQLKKFLVKAEITQKLEEVIGSIVKWVLMLVFFVAATNILGLITVSELLTSILIYIPNVLSAVIVIAIGVLLAGIVESLVKGALASIDLKTSRLMGKVASYVVIIVAVLAAFSELHIAKNFINILFIGVVTMLALGIGLAIGLGSKDLIAQILKDWYTTLKKDLKKK